jgi:predicted glycosyltransferase
MKRKCFENRYLIEIPHPHFVHFFKNIITRLGRENVVITCQRSGIISDLLDRAGFDYVVLGKKYRGIPAKAFGQILYLVKFLKLIREKKIGYLLGMSPALALAAKITGREMFFFDDDDSAVQPITKKLTVPLSDYVITPRCLQFENYGKKHYSYAGYQELAYLAPAYFKPDVSVVRKYGLEPDSYFLIRWNAFLAYHDGGHSGILEGSKRKLIEELEPRGRILISSEYELAEEYGKYRLEIDPLDIHHIMAFARMFIGDSQTMTAEAAVLGTPAIRCNSFKGKIAYLKELEEVYELTYAFFPTESEAMLEKIRSLLRQGDIKRIWKERRDAMLAQMIDVNQFILDLLKAATMERQ